MTNKEKAEEIANNESLYVDTDNLSKIDECRIAAMAMAVWKDKQLAAEKSALIDRIVKEFDFEDLTYLNGYGGLYFDFDRFAKFLDRVSGITITD